MPGNQPSKEFRASLRANTAKQSYSEKLQDVRWKRKRDDLLRASGYTCCECAEPLTQGTMDRVQQRDDSRGFGVRKDQRHAPQL